MNEPKLSPSQKVRVAAFSAYNDETSATGEQHAGKIAAAAIRELMNQVAPQPPGFPTCKYMDGYLKSKKRLRMRSLAIADELEGLAND